MEASKVYYTDFRCPVGTSLLDKLRRLCLAAIRFLMDSVKRHDFKFFGAYRIVLGIIVLAVAAATAIF